MSRAASIIEIRSVASTLLQAKAEQSRWSIGYGQIAGICGLFASLSLVLVAVSTVTSPLRILGVTFTALSLLGMFGSLTAYALVRWKPEGDPTRAAKPGAPRKAAPKGISKQARMVLVITAGVLIGLSGAGAWVLAAASGELGRAALPPKSITMVPEPPPEMRADHKLKREGHVPVIGGVGYIPSSFRSDNGEFDVVMHFHGNTELVKQSMDAAKINAFIFIVNLGIGSGQYEQQYSVPGMFDDTLARIQDAAAKRGLRDAKVGRIALSAWSAGYGAVAKILDAKGNIDKVDAVLMLDGIHAAFVDPVNKTGVDPLRIEPFVRFAKNAAEGKKLFTITHSDIRTLEYASTTETSDELLKATGLERSRAKETPPKVTLPASVGAMSKEAEQWLQQTTEARKGGFHVRGYVGQTPEHHMTHLIQMSVTVLPELADRWR